eukprot:scaffold160523_cov33-Tisochrysis_lutea.AAC.1
MAGRECASWSNFHFASFITSVEEYPCVVYLYPWLEGRHGRTGDSFAEPSHAHATQQELYNDEEGQHD